MKKLSKTTKRIYAALILGFLIMPTIFAVTNPYQSLSTPPEVFLVILGLEVAGLLILLLIIFGLYFIVEIFKAIYNG